MGAEEGPPSTAPRFADLPLLPDSEERHAWDVWGRDDQIGSVNWLGPEQVAYACTLATAGRVISLTLPLDEPNPGLFPSRSPYVHTITSSGHGHDDRIDNLFPQFSSQWDGLRHVKFRHHGYWGGRQEQDLDEGGDLGIERWARHGMIGRGVLLDVKRHVEARGGDFAPDVRHEITPELLEEVAVAQNVGFRQGDIVMFRTGWTEWYLELDAARRAELHGSVGREPTPFACPGLDSKRTTAEWLWDHRVSAIASDNVAVEALPVQRADGFLHYRMIPLLGLAVGEMWLLGELAAACADLGRYEFLFSAAILDVPGGVGSPANAYAVL